MRAVICAACHTLLGYIETDSDTQAQQAAHALATAHTDLCTATEEEYEQAVIDLKFRQITEGLDL